MKQPWDWYLDTMGPDAWECLDGTMRHEVEVFVKLKILKLDPAAYAVSGLFNPIQLNN